MNVRFQAFGALWLLTVVVCVAAAGVLVSITHRLHLVGFSEARTPLLGAAVLEAFIVMADVGVRLGAAALRDSGLVLLDLWTVARPLLHSLTLVLVAVAVTRFARRPSTTRT